MVTQVPQPRPQAATASAASNLSDDRIWNRTLGKYENLLLTSYISVGATSSSVEYYPDLDMVKDSLGKTYPNARCPTTLQISSYLEYVAERLLPELMLIGDIFYLKKNDSIKWFKTRKQWIYFKTSQKVLGLRAPALEGLRRSGYCRPLNYCQLRRKKEDIVNYCDLLWVIYNFCV
jgi:hypothetical protein